MKMANDNKTFPRHLQLPLGFDKTDPGDLKQQDTLLHINRMIETISELLDNVRARDEVKNMALVELQKIKKAIEFDRPGSHIPKQREIAG